MVSKFHALLKLYNTNYVKNKISDVTLTMPRAKFQTISRYITFDDIETRTREDSKFHKMQHIFSQFQKNILNAMEPNTHTGVDETLYVFRGKCPCRQYMHSKPAKYDIKYLCLCDVDTSYLCDVQVYVEKEVNEIRTLEWILYWIWWKVLRTLETMPLQIFFHLNNTLSRYAMGEKTSTCWNNES